MQWLRDRLFARGALVLGLLWILGFPLLFKPWIHGFDTVAYYSWLRSAVIDGDLNVGDEFVHYGYGTERGLTVTGYTYNEWAVGSAVLWSPFFLAAHGGMLVAQALGAPVVPDGYAAPYIWAISLGSALYAGLALLWTYRLCAELFSPRTGLLATVTLWLASPLVFYMYSHPAMSHANDAFAFALLLFVWQRTRQRQTWSAPVWRGLAAGLCALVRQQNAVWVLVLLGELAVEAVQAWRTDRSSAVIKTAVGQAALFSLAWWVAYFPQLVVWKVVFGRWIVLNPYAGGAGIGFDWLHPHLLKVLFSTNRGLFVWSPVLLPALLGWGLLGKSERRLGWVLAASFGVQLYMVSAWGAWSGAAAFGQRFFTNLVPAFTVGAAALLDRLQRRVPFSWLVGLCGLAVGWNGLLLVRYALEDVPRMGSVPWGQLIGGQFTALPRLLGRVWKILLYRTVP